MLYTVLDDYFLTLSGGFSEEVSTVCSEVALHGVTRQTALFCKSLGVLFVS